MLSLLEIKSPLFHAFALGFGFVSRTLFHPDSPVIFKTTLTRVGSFIRQD